MGRSAKGVSEVMSRVMSARMDPLAPQVPSGNVVDPSVNGNQGLALLPSAEQKQVVGSQFELGSRIQRS